MKTRLLNSFLSCCVIAVTFACASKEARTGDESAEWKEMDDFHMVMAETFHPYKDSANLEPVKTRAGELAASAEAWAKATLPSKVDNDAVKRKLEELKEETASLVSTVQTGDDEAIGQQLTSVHDLFHGIQELWYEGDHGGHEHGHDHSH